LEGKPVTYFCTIFNHDYTFGTEQGPASATLVATTTVRADSPRAAAAKGYVRGVGSDRARLLQDVLHAPPTVVRQETDWRAIAPGLMRSPEQGNCYCFDNLVEAWYITVEPTPLSLSRRLPRPSRRRLLSSRRRLLHSLRHPSPN
jgi:hypothetical protein